jgi:hypothetical protein
MQSAKEEPGLEEVKLVLQKLQRIDLLRDSLSEALGEPQSFANQSQHAGLTHNTNIRLFDRKFFTKGAKISAAVYFLGAGALIAVAIIISASGVINLSSQSKGYISTGNSQTAELRQKEQKLLANARRALNDGDTMLARTLLEQSDPDHHANVAFMLAQSYDPNFLQSLTKANSQPDRVTAKRWYEKWHKLAVANGLEMDSERLQRIINAMH